MDNGVKYIKKTVEYDTDFIKRGNLITTNSEKVTKEEVVLLETILEGEINLFSFERNGKKIFYMGDKNNRVEYLFYKKYIDSRGDFKENNSFRQQLYDKCKCDENDLKKFLKLKYSTDDIAEVVTDYNKCKGILSNKQNTDKRKPDLKVAPIFGVMISKFEFNGDDSSFFKTVNEDFNRVTPFFGAEVSIRFPSKNNRYEIFSRIEFSKSNYSKTLVDNNEVTNVNSERIYSFQSLNTRILFGPRFYFNSKSENKVFLDGALGVIIPSDDLKYKTTTTVPTTGNQTLVFVEEEFFNTSVNFVASFGLGYLYNNKIGIDFRVFTSNNFTKSYTNIVFKDSNISFSIKYLFF